MNALTGSQGHNHEQEIKAIAAFLQFSSGKGWRLYSGFTGREPVDFIVDDGRKLLKVEVKWAGLRDHRRIGKAQGMAAEGSGTKKTTDLSAGGAHGADIRRHPFDFLFVATALGSWYWVPHLSLTGRGFWVGRYHSQFDKYRVREMD